MATNDKKPNLVILSEALGADTAGLITMWRLSGDVDTTNLRIVWASADLASALLPEPPSNQVALRRAVMEHHNVRIDSTTRRLVRPLDGGGWVVTTERRNKTHVEYEHAEDFRIALDETDSPKWESNAAASRFELADQIIKAFEEALSALDRQDISGWLAGTIMPHVGAQRLRDSGGAYYIPQHRRAEWERITSALEEVSQHAIMSVPCMPTDGVVRYVLGCLEDEIVREADKIATEMAEQDLGLRALQTRHTQLDAAKSKVAHYERMLGPITDELRAKLEELNAHLSTAILLAVNEREKEDAARAKR